MKREGAAAAAPKRSNPLLKDKGVRLVEFDAARSPEDAKKQIHLMGEVTGHPDRAHVQIDRLDAAVARVHQLTARKPYRVLAVSRRGWVTGGDSLTSSLLANGSPRLRARARGPLRC